MNTQTSTESPPTSEPSFYHDPNIPDEFMGCSKSEWRQRLLAEWSAMTNDEQDEIFDDFREAVFDGGQEPSEYWYPLLIDWCG